MTQPITDDAVLIEVHTLNYYHALVIALIIALAIVLSVPVYEAGKKSALRECPIDQHDQRLLRSEQAPGALLCYYATYWEGYGRRIIVRKVTP